MGRLVWLIILAVPVGIKGIIWPEPEEPPRTDVEPLQRRLVLESATLLELLNAQMQERGDEEWKPCRLKYFAWDRQRNRVYIELECR